MDSHELVEGLAAVILLTCGPLLVVRAWLDRHGPPLAPLRSPAASARRAAWCVAAALSAAAGVLQLQHAGEHSGDPVRTILFVLAGVAQLAWALFAVPGVPRASVVVSGLALSAGAAIAWAGARAMGTADTDLAAFTVLAFELLGAGIILVARSTRAWRAPLLRAVALTGAVPAIGLVGIAVLITIAQAAGAPAEHLH